MPSFYPPPGFHLDPNSMLYYKETVTESTREVTWFDTATGTSQQVSYPINPEPVQNAPYEQHWSYDQVQQSQYFDQSYVAHQKATDAYSAAIDKASSVASSLGTKAFLGIGGALLALTGAVLGFIFIDFGGYEEIDISPIELKIMPVNGGTYFYLENMDVPTLQGFNISEMENNSEQGFSLIEMHFPFTSGIKGFEEGETLYEYALLFGDYKASVKLEATDFDMAYDMFIEMDGIVDLYEKNDDGEYVSMNAEYSYVDVDYGGSMIVQTDFYDVMVKDFIDFESYDEFIVQIQIGDYMGTKTFTYDEALY